MKSGTRVVVTWVPELANRLVLLGALGVTESDVDVKTGLIQVRIGQYLFWWNTKDLQELPS
jgi:hypothetical protein